MNSLVATSSNRTSRASASSRVGRPPRRLVRSRALIPVLANQNSPCQLVEDKLYKRYSLVFSDRNLIRAFLERQESQPQGWRCRQPAWRSPTTRPGCHRGRPLADCHWGTSSGRGGSHGKFGHAQSVNVPACHALCSNLSMPQHRGCTSGASRPFLFLTDTDRCFAVIHSMLFHREIP
jgi:hypothetical protein